MEDQGNTTNTTNANTNSSTTRNSNSSRHNLPPLSNLTNRRQSDSDAINYQFLHPSHPNNNNNNNSNNSSSNDNDDNHNITSSERSLSQLLIVDDNNVERLRLSSRSNTIGGSIDTSFVGDSFYEGSNSTLYSSINIGPSGSFMSSPLATHESHSHGMSMSMTTTPNHHHQTNSQDEYTSFHSNDEYANNNGGTNPNGINTGIPTIIPSYDDPQLIDPHAITPIILEVARLGAWDEVNKLAISHPGSAKFKRDGLLPLHHVCNRRCPNPNVYHNLIQAYPDALIDVADGNGWTPLHYATRFKCSKEAVKLLLLSHPSKGNYAAQLRCKEKGRTPLYYALRYDAPEGVVELLLSCMSKEDILDGDKEGKSALGLIWGNYVNSLNGNKRFKRFPNRLKKWENENVPWEQRVEEAHKLRSELSGEICDRWKKANMLLRGAFRFPLKDDDSSSSSSKCNSSEKEGEGGEAVTGTVASPQDQQEPKRERTWRILHAAASMRNYPSLAMMALVLYPEQVREIDNQDLFGPTKNNNTNISNIHTNHYTALHLAAKSAMSGRESQTIISHLLEMYPEAASIINPADNSYPLHYVCENPSKLEWEQDITPIYNVFPEAMLRQDINGRTPFHRAFTIVSQQPTPPAAPPGTPTVGRYSIDPDVSIVQNILSLHHDVASISDNDGKLPFHSLAEYGEIWDENVQCLYDAYPRAVSTRTNQQSGNNLPIHLVASNPDAKPSLINKIVELNPRGATLENSQGKLPLHLACESGKTFEGGFESIYNAFHNAINLSERNDRGWMPLHFTVTSPNSTTEHIERVLNLNSQAAYVVDGSSKTVLHLAIESGKDWDNGLELLFDANPDAIEVEDGVGKIPLVTALLTYQNSNTTTTVEQPLVEESNNDDVQPTNENDAEESESQHLLLHQDATEESGNLEELHLSQVNVLYHLLKSAPYVLRRTLDNGL